MKLEDDPISDEEFQQELSSLLEGLVDRSRAERHGTEPWKDLWSASEHGLEALLSQAEFQTSQILLGLSEVVIRRFGLKRTTPRLYDLLKALPFAMGRLKDTIYNEQGLACSSDKARLIYSQAVLAEIRRIQAVDEGTS